MSEELSCLQWCVYKPCCIKKPVHSINELSEGWALVNTTGCAIRHCFYFWRGKKSAIFYCSWAKQRSFSIQLHPSLLSWFEILWSFSEVSWQYLGLCCREQYIWELSKLSARSTLSRPLANNCTFKSCSDCSSMRMTVISFQGVKCCYSVLGDQSSVSITDKFSCHWLLGWV